MAATSNTEDFGYEKSIQEDAFKDTTEWERDDRLSNLLKEAKGGIHGQASCLYVPPEVLSEVTKEAVYRVNHFFRR